MRMNYKIAIIACKVGSSVNRLNWIPELVKRSWFTSRYLCEFDKAYSHLILSINLCCLRVSGKHGLAYDATQSTTRIIVTSRARFLLSRYILSVFGQFHLLQYHEMERGNVWSSILKNSPFLFFSILSFLNGRLDAAGWSGPSILLGDWSCHCLFALHRSSLVAACFSRIRGLRSCVWRHSRDGKDHGKVRSEVSQRRL